MIEHAFIISMIVLFLHACTWKTHIFEGIKKIIDPEKKIAKPIFVCPICMSPYYGTLIYFLFFGNDWREWLLTIFCASGISVVSVVLIAIKDYCVSRTIDKEDCCE